jgi:hypothetical protein
VIERTVNFLNEWPTRVFLLQTDFCKPFAGINSVEWEFSWDRFSFLYQGPTVDRETVARNSEPLASDDARRNDKWFLFAVPVICLCLGVSIRYVAAAYAVGTFEPQIAVFEALCRWDCVWYLNIAEQGYDSFPTAKTNNVGNWGFFPLYPAMVGLFGAISPLSTLQTATLLSLALTFLSCLVAWPLLNGNRSSYIVYCVYFLAGPLSFHFATSLTESLFVLNMSLVMLALKRRNYPAAGVATALLSATRIIGVFMVLAMGATILQNYLREGGKISRFPAYVIRHPHLILSIIISPLGLFAYILLLAIVVGDGFAFANVQRAFGRQVDWPWLHWWDAATYASATSWWPTPSQWSAMAFVFALGLVVVLAARRQYGMALFCLIAIVLPISSGMASIIRYSAALVPLVLTLTSILVVSRISAWGSVGVFLLLCYVFTGYWIGGYLAFV